MVSKDLAEHDLSKFIFHATLILKNIYVCVCVCVCRVRIALNYSEINFPYG